MFTESRRKKARESALKMLELNGQVAAISKSQAVIEFSLTGEILSANENFLATMGYTLDEVQGKHHRIFVDPKERESAGYREFWDKLGKGQFEVAQYKRVTKEGREIWLQASYNPIMDEFGRPMRVIKFATDISAQKLKNADFEGQLAAISKVMAVIEFGLDGHVLTANENFLSVLGYALSDIQGKHHRQFVDAAEHDSPEYRRFWEKLARGEFDAGRYRRVGRGGREVWIQASYNPIFDPSGRPLKIVKYATDITAEIHASRSLDAAVTRTEQVVQAAQAGDLTQRVELVEASADLQKLADSVNDLLETVDNIVSEASQAAQAINTAAKEIAQGNADLSQRTEQQATNLDRTASSMSDMTSQVRSTAESAQLAAKLGQAATELADKGRAVVKDVVSTMSEISNASNQIANITSVIDGIAFQTNILALNAAVEAARAGDQGRGFAVVASEVRSLSQRSAEAAKEIKALISSATVKIADGVSLVDNAGGTMEAISDSVSKITVCMGEIKEATVSQSEGIGQVNHAMANLNDSTQQNSAQVEQAAAAAEALEEQAQTLYSSVSRFTTGSSARASVALRPVPRRVVGRG